MKLQPQQEKTMTNLSFKQLSKTGSVFVMTEENSIIEKITIDEKIKPGQSFSIEYSINHYTPNVIVNVIWETELQFTDAFISGVFAEMITNQPMFIGSKIKSIDFVNKVSDSITKCECLEPNISHHKSKTLVAVDLDYPESPRDESRYIVYKTKCVDCEKAITIGTSFASYATVGLGELKELASNHANKKINFKNVITTQF